MGAVDGNSPMATTDTVLPQPTEPRRHQRRDGRRAASTSARNGSRVGNLMVSSARGVAWRSTRTARRRRWRPQRCPASARRLRSRAFTHPPCARMLTAQTGSGGILILPPPFNSPTRTDVYRTGSCPTPGRPPRRTEQTTPGPPSLAHARPLLSIYRSRTPHY